MADGIGKELPSSVGAPENGAVHGQAIASAASSDAAKPSGSAPGDGGGVSAGASGGGNDAAGAKASKKKPRSGRRRREFRRMVVRLLLLVAVLYVLFFQLIGVTSMPNGDMYPRVDAGDLVLYYRLDKQPSAQDIIVFTKNSADLPEYDVAAALQDAAAAAEKKGDEQAQGTSAKADTDIPSPSSLPAASPAEIAEKPGFWPAVSRAFYNVAEFLNLRQKSGTRLFIGRVVAVAGDTVEITEEGRLLVNGNAVIETNIFPTSVTMPYLGFTRYPLTLKEGECFVLSDRRSGGMDSRFFGPVLESETLGTVITIMRRNNL